MFLSQPFDAYNSHAATHSERASVFIGETMTANDREEATHTADSFFNVDKPAARTAVLIPVAAHQDKDYILPALTEYANQMTEKPFTVFLHLNAPLDLAHTDPLDEAENEVDRARKSFPHLDIRSSGTYYYKANIGRIRRDLWNAAYLLSYHEHGFSSDVIGINNDIDAHRISPHYISRVQQYYERRAQQSKNLIGNSATTSMIQKPIATRVTHAVLPTHPNTGKVTTWIDNTYFQTRNNAWYEAGLAIPFSSYAHLGGFQGDAITHETAWVQQNGSLRYISGAHLYTSPRRYISRLAEHASSAIWTDDTFGPNDECRDIQRSDISSERAEDVIIERLHGDIEQHWLSSAMTPIYKELELGSITGKEVNLQDLRVDATERAIRQLAKAERLLRQVIGSTVLADILRDSYDPAEYAKTQTMSMYYFYESMRNLSTA